MIYNLVDLSTGDSNCHVEALETFSVLPYILNREPEIEITSLKAKTFGYTNKLLSREWRLFYNSPHFFAFLKTPEDRIRSIRVRGAMNIIRMGLVILVTAYFFNKTTTHPLLDTISISMRKIFYL